MKRNTVIQSVIGCTIVAGVGGALWTGFLREPEAVQLRASLPTNQVLEPKAVSEAILQATNGGEINPRQRDADLAALVGQMGSSDGEVLLDFALGKPPVGTSLEQWHGIVNDCFNILRRPGCGAPSFVERLISVVNDDARDAVMRDYSIQHLRAYYSDSDPSSTRESDPEVRRRIETTILAASKKITESWSGTALLALDHMLSKCASEAIPPSFGASDVDSTALLHASSSETHLLARISAVQLCAERKLAATLPVLRELVNSTETQTSLRLSTIAALGQLGDSSDLVVLETLSTGGDSRISTGSEIDGYPCS